MGSALERCPYYFNMTETLILFVVGFFILIKGADFLIDGASSIAERFNISHWIIGITIVGVGTSIPEFSITFLEALRGEASIGFGAILGSNTFNILFILGLSAMILPLSVKPIWVRSELMVNIYAIVIAAVLTILPLGGGGFFEITRIEGIGLLLLFFIWMFYLVLRNGTAKQLKTKEGPSLKIFAIPLSAVMIIAGLAGVVLGARWVVEGGQLLAGMLGTSEAIIGLTIVGIGTSLPELVVSVSAARKGNVGISLGNIIGSNVFDFFGILGITAIASGIHFPRELTADFMVTLGAAVLLLVAMFIGRSRYTLEKWQGFIFVILYILYIVTIGRI